MLPYKHITLSERKYLQELLSQGKNIRFIAASLGRSPSTISREIKRNSTKYAPRKPSDNRYQYHHWRAQTLTIARRRKKIKKAIEPGSAQWLYIQEKLDLFWSPEEICKRWQKDFPEEKTLCVSTVYRYIKNGSFGKKKVKTHLRRRGKRLLSKNTNCCTIHPDRIIPEWPEEIQSRCLVGHWEGDTVYGGIGKGLLVTLVDRKSRYLRLGLLKSRNAADTRMVIEQLLENLPVRSISLDNGSEFSEFRELETELNTLVYFAEPHKPWQRGTNENTNDIVRFFFPKGCDLRDVTAAEVQAVEDLINNRPRKCLNWATPAEVFLESVALA